MDRVLVAYWGAIVILVGFCFYGLHLDRAQFMQACMTSGYSEFECSMMDQGKVLTKQEKCND